VPCYIYRVWSDVPQVAIACSLLYKSDSMFQRSFNLRRPSWRCHGDGWRQAVAAILKCGLTFTGDVTFVQPGYPISSIPKTLSRQKNKHEFQLQERITILMQMNLQFFIVTVFGIRKTSDGISKCKII
jgi:hypothetical protein